MFTPLICASEDCGGILVTDVTGESATGYGEETGIASPSAFSSITFRFWKDGQDTSGPPLATVVWPMGDIPTPDDEFHFGYMVTLAQLGVEFIESGVWYVEMAVVYSTTTYEASFAPTFTGELDKKIRSLMPKVDPTGKCNSGCVPWERLATLLDSVRCFTACSAGRSSFLIRYIRTQLRNCC